MVSNYTCTSALDTQAADVSRTIFKMLVLIAVWANSLVYRDQVHVVAL